MATLLDIPRPVKTYHSETYDRISSSKSSFDGNGKTVLITGGAAGIGFSIATSFAKAGVKRLILTSRSEGPQAKAKEALLASYPDVGVQTCQAAVTDQARMNDVMRTHGPVDILILCAANTHAQDKPTTSLPLSEIEECFQTNVIGNYGIVLSYLGQPAPSSGQKTIINVSSGSSHIAIPNQAGYGPSKTAFTQMISRLTMEHTPDMGVRMFSYHPGAFYTQTAAKAGFKGHEFEWEDIKLPGDFAVWLSGPESTFLNGKYVWAQWDVDELIELKDKIEADPSFLTLGLVQ